MVPFHNLKSATSRINNAKCPVTFVVNSWNARKPVTFTIPATKDRMVAMRKLCDNVLLLP